MFSVAFHPDELNCEFKETFSACHVSIQSDVAKTPEKQAGL